jgi:hypothetical protein
MIYAVGITLPGPVDRSRFLGLELVPGALAQASGLVAPLYQPLPLVARAPVNTVFAGLFDPEFDPSLC